MPIATIVSVTATGEPPYPSQYGPFYKFLVFLSDGVSGKVNAKNANGPSYKPGQPVGYTISGNHNGVNDLKIDAKAAQGAGVVVMPAVPAQPIIPLQVAQSAAMPQSPLAQSVPPITQPHGEAGPRQGMWINNGMQVILHNAKAVAEPIDMATLPQTLWEVASLIKEADLALQAGVKPEKDPF